MYLLIDCSPYVISNCFINLCTTLGVDELRTTAYHPQKRSHIEPLACCKIQHYFPKHRENKDNIIYVTSVSGEDSDAQGTKNSHF